MLLPLLLDLNMFTKVNPIALDIQKLSPGNLWEGFELDLSTIGVNEQFYFHSGVNALGNDVVWQGITYTRFPIEAKGFQRNGTGQQPRPTITVANITGLIGALARANGDLVKAKVIRRRTFIKYLDAVNFTGAINATADPNVYLPDEIWYIDRKSAENKVFVEWELASAYDLSGVMLPRRQCIQNVCTWRYRSTECGYTGGAVADINDLATTNLTLDDCSHRLTGCKFRFPGLPLPFGGFSSVGLIR